VIETAGAQTPKPVGCNAQTKFTVTLLAWGAAGLMSMYDAC